MIYGKSSTRNVRKFCVAVRMLDIYEGDIINHSCDVIVCPDGKDLSGKGGLAKKIHQTAGPQLKEEIASVDECPTDLIRVTDAYQLNSKYIFHTVSPCWEGGINFEEAQLSNCYASAMQKAADLQCATIAFPSLGTGYHKFPKRRAAEIAISTVLYSIMAIPNSARVSIVCATNETYEIYKNAFKQIIVKMFLDYYSPESYVCNRLSVKKIDPYYVWMVKLGDLETTPHNYLDYVDVIGFKYNDHQELTKSQYYYLLSKKSHLWDYRTCLAYIIALQRASHWDEWISYHDEQCKLGGVRNVLLRMQSLLQQS